MSTSTNHRESAAVGRRVRASHFVSKWRSIQSYWFTSRLLCNQPSLFAENVYDCRFLLWTWRRPWPRLLRNNTVASETSHCVCVSVNIYSYQTCIFRMLRWFYSAPKPITSQPLRILLPNELFPVILDYLDNRDFLLFLCASPHAYRILKQYPQIVQQRIETFTLQIIPFQTLSPTYNTLAMFEWKRVCFTCFQCNVNTSNTIRCNACYLEELRSMGAIDCVVS